MSNVLLMFIVAGSVVIAGLEALSTLGTFWLSVVRRVLEEL